MTTNAKSLPTDSPDLDLRPGRGAALLAWGAAHLRPWLIAAVVVLFAVATFREFHALEFHALRSALENVDVPLAVIAALLALVGVAGMGFYDVIALGSPWDAPPITQLLR